ncbi:MAG: ABC transporter permease subunit [Nitrososphaerota archaeon]|jgi:ABC-2 type transport system permease protein|nr:ABC transporter permease subunit [Nitrososphaerota archaeon]
MNPLLYDVRRAFTSKGVLAVMIFIIVFSLAIIPLIGNSQVSLPPPISQVAYSVIDEPNGFNILFYVYNSFGQPLSGVTLNVTSSTPGLFSQVTKSNSSGFAFMVIPYPNQNTTTSYLATLQSSLNSNVVGIQLLPPSSKIGSIELGQPEPPATLGTVADPNNSSRTDIFVFAVGPNFTKPDDSIYYQITAQNLPPSLSNMTPLSRVSNYVSSAYITVPSDANPADFLWIVLATSNGTILISEGSPVQSYLSVAPQLNANELASTFFSSLLGLFVPLMAIIGAYSVYGRDRVTGILESVLVRPVTRRGVLVSRYVSIVAAVTLATVITILIVDLIVWYEIKEALGMTFVLESVGSLFVEIAAFVGIIFIVSQFTKSTGALIGSGIGLFLVLDLLWSLLLALAVTATGVSFGSLSALRLQVDLSFVNPSQFIGLLQILQFRSLSGIPIQPSQFGITPVTLILTGALWVAVPVLLAIRIVRSRD